MGNETGVQNMTSPSHWMVACVKRSFLRGAVEPRLSFRHSSWCRMACRGGEIPSVLFKKAPTNHTRRHTAQTERKRGHTPRAFPVRAGQQLHVAVQQLHGADRHGVLQVIDSLNARPPPPGRGAAAPTHLLGGVTRVPHGCHTGSHSCQTGIT